MQNYVLPVVLLIASNLFMTVAWYWHLKFKHLPIATVVMVSWGIALIEYTLAVPANRIGYGVYTAHQLKTLQEVITLTVFVGFSAFYLGQGPTWNTLIGFSLIALGAYFVFRG
ncbi:MAG: DMT family protein [Parvibaculum sp.]|uniref:DMT family protein n=1 Tax=Parvibaculum sp. TaxID=2024848 RepID=UPI0027238BD9|nr:DMT family protein [Parvibaculum sp.]MDO8837533.1 DMT family protein [Parvibaculum sp.]MDP2125561.1 DMT family protein [Parvibaculum sp.]MDZ4380832.1 DMT family protein [Parvibaculum sp.]